jgi:hypothetical protein
MRVPLLKIVLGFYALLAGLGDTFGIRWPTLYHDVLAYIKAGFASFSQLTALSCQLHMNQYGDMCCWTIGLLIALAAAQTYASAKSQSATKLLFYVALFAYPFVSPAVISIFICRTVDGTSYLVADYTLHCHTQAWKLAVVWCSLWFALYVIGLPVFVAHTVRSLATEETELAFLYAGYRNDKDSRICKYWEVLEMLRKLFLTSLVLLFDKGTTMQISIATVWSLVFLVAHALYQPFTSPEDNRLQTLALASLSSTYFIGVLIQVRPTAGQSAEFATLLSMLGAVVACAGTASTALHACKKGGGAVKTVKSQRGRLEQLASATTACCCRRCRTGAKSVAAADHGCSSEEPALGESLLPES